MQPEGDRQGGRRLLLLRSKCYKRLSIRVDQSAKKLLNTQSRQLPWSCTVCCARVRHTARAYVQFTVDFVVLAGVREDRIEVRCITIALVPV